MSPLVTNAVLEAQKGGFRGKDITLVRDLQDCLNADLCGLYSLDKHLRPNFTLTSRPANHFLKGYEDFRNRDPMLLHLLRGRRRAIDSVSLLGFEAWVRHPLRRFMKNWNLQYSLQGAIWNGDLMVATLNFARAERYGPFTPKEANGVEALCDLISSELFTLHDAGKPQVSIKTAIHFSEDRKGTSIHFILSDGSGNVLNTDLDPKTVHENLTQYDLEKNITRSISTLRTQRLASVEREVLGNQTVIAKLMTFSVPHSRNFMTIVVRATPERDVHEEHLAALGARRRYVLDLLVRGYSNKLIAREMGISENSVKDHVQHLYRHFGVSRRTELTWILHG